MMKKTALLIGSVAAVALLAGGVFAAYTVTDNANPFGVKVSPGAIESETVGSVTLAWGENVTQNVQNLANGGVGKIGSIVLKATKEGTGNDDTNYSGLLGISFQDLTGYSTAREENKKLVNLLTIKVFAGKVVYDAESGKYYKADEHGDKTEQLAGEPAAATKVDQDVILAGNKAGIEYSVFAEMDSVSPAVYNICGADIVYITFDWKRAEADAQKMIYVSKPAGWGEKIYAYAWKEAPVVTNDDWPGVKMTKVSGSLYSYEYTAGMAKVIFTDNEGHQTVDLTINGDQPYWTIGSVVEEEGADKGHYNASSSATAPVELADHYVTGEFNSVNKWYPVVGFVPELAMVAATDAQNEAELLNLALGVNDQLKIIDKDGATWHGANFSDEFAQVKKKDNTVVAQRMEDGNYKILVAGNYNVYLSKDTNMYISYVE